MGELGCRSESERSDGLLGKSAGPEQLTRQGCLLETHGEYERAFVAVQRKWEAKGAEVKSIYLRFCRFPWEVGSRKGSISPCYDNQQSQYVDYYWDTVTLLRYGC